MIETAELWKKLKASTNENEICDLVDEIARIRYAGIYRDTFSVGYLAAMLASERREKSNV